MKELVQNAGSGKKYLHRLQHENHTTANFGFVQPLMVNERAARDSVTLRCGQSVFLTPMSKPTFGRVVCKTYESFVPIVDIWHPYESFWLLSPIMEPTRIISRVLCRMYLRSYLRLS